MIFTIAPVILALSRSISVSAGSIAIAGWFSVYPRLWLAPIDGASFTAVTLMVSVAPPQTMPSLAMKVTVRGAAEGLSLVLA